MAIRPTSEGSKKKIYDRNNFIHIGDFTRWQDDATYQQRFAELLRHLKVKTL